MSRISKLIVTVLVFSITIFTSNQVASLLARPLLSRRVIIKLSSSSSSSSSSSASISTADAPNPSTSPSPSSPSPSPQFYHPDVSEETLQEALSIAFPPSHADALKQKVEAALQSDYDLKEGVNPSKIKAQPLKANIDLWSYNAKQRLLAGDFKAALSLYEKCTQYDPTDGRGWLGSARVWRKKGKVDMVNKAFKEGLYYCPKNPFLLQAWACELEKRGEAREAMKVLSSSVKTSPNHAASWVSLGKLYQRSGDYERARECFSNAASRNPSSYVALHAWGCLEEAFGKPSEARILFQRAMTVNEKSSHAVQSLALLELRQGNYHDAQRLLSSALQANPSCTRLHLPLTEALEMTGQISAARRCFTAGDVFAARCGDAGFYQAWALFEVRQLGESFV